MKVLFLSLLGLWPALSSTISVSSTGFTLTATATLTPAGTYAYDSQSYSQSYMLSINGGTGWGMAYPDFALIGATNESNGALNLLGSTAEFAVTGLYDITAGNPYGPAGPTGPGFFCGPHTLGGSCGIPFTFGVPETIDVRAFVDAAIQPGPGAPSTFSQTVSGSVTFNFDSFAVIDSEGRVFTGDPTLTPVPEPGTWLLLIIGSSLSFPRFRRLSRSTSSGG